MEIIGNRRKNAGTIAFHYTILYSLYSGFSQFYKKNQTLGAVQEIANIAMELGHIKKKYVMTYKFVYLNVHGNISKVLVPDENYGF